MGSSEVSTSYFNTKKSSSNASLRMILTGLAGIVIVEIYAAVMQREFQNTNNQVGKGFAILGIYLFVVIYCKFSFSGYLVKDRSADVWYSKDGMLNSTTWLYGK